MAASGQNVKMFITLEKYGMFESYFVYLLFKYCPATGMKMMKRLCRASFWLVEPF